MNSDTRDPLDSVFASDRDRGSTPPESGPASSNVVGRPDGDGAAGFHQPTESDDVEREGFDIEEAQEEGGSYDGLGLPVATE